MTDRRHAADLADQMLAKTRERFVSQALFNQGTALLAAALIDACEEIIRLHNVIEFLQEQTDVRPGETEDENAGI